MVTTDETTPLSTKKNESTKIIEDTEKAVALKNLDDLIVSMTIEIHKLEKKKGKKKEKENMTKNKQECKKLYCLQRNIFQTKKSLIKNKHCPLTSELLCNPGVDYEDVLDFCKKKGTTAFVTHETEEYRSFVVENMSNRPLGRPKSLGVYHAGSFW